MLRCGDGSLYTGWTNNLEKRLLAHSRGEGAKYTHSHLPVRLVYYETFADSGSARKREAAVKHLKKSEKEKLPGLLSEEEKKRVREINSVCGIIGEEK